MIAKDMHNAATHPYSGSRSIVESPKATMICTNNRLQTGKCQISSNNETTIKRLTPTQISGGMTTEKKFQLRMTANSKPKPPTRGTGIECNEREFGKSNAQPVLLFINPKIEKKATANESSGAANADKGKSITIVTGLSVIGQ